MRNPEGPSGHDQANHEHDSLKYSLLGPSLTKPGQDNVDQTKVREERSRGEIILTLFTGCRDHIQRVAGLEVFQQ